MKTNNKNTEINFLNKLHISKRINTKQLHIGNTQSLYIQIHDIRLTQMYINHITNLRQKPIWS